LIISATSLTSNVCLITIILILLCVVSRNNRPCLCEIYSDEDYKWLETKAKNQLVESTNCYAVYQGPSNQEFDGDDNQGAVANLIFPAERPAQNKKSRAKTQKPPKHNPSIQEFDNSDFYETLDEPLKVQERPFVQTPNKNNLAMAQIRRQYNPSVQEPVNEDCYEDTRAWDNNQNQSLNAVVKSLKVPGNAINQWLNPAQSHSPQPNRHQKLASMNNLVNQQPQDDIYEDPDITNQTYRPMRQPTTATSRPSNNRPNRPLPKVDANNSGIEEELYMDASKRDAFVKTLNNLALLPNLTPRPTIAYKKSFSKKMGQ
jgi:hypothetical protein